MNKGVIYKLIGVVLILYVIIQFGTGILGTPLIPSTNIITLIIGAPIVLVCILLVGVYLMVEKES